MRLASVLILVCVAFSGCTTSLGSVVETETDEKPGARVIAILREYGSPVRVTIQTLTGVEVMASATYSVEKTTLTPRLDQDLACDLRMDKLRAIVFALDGRQIGVSTYPAACNEEQFTLLIDDDGKPYFFPLVKPMPANWARGDPWPWTEEPVPADPPAQPSSPDTAPAVSFSKDEARDRVEVTSARSGADWSRLTVSVTACTQESVDGTTRTAGAVIVMGTAMPYQNDLAASGGAPLNAADNRAGATNCGQGQVRAVSNSGAKIVAGDFIEFCNASTGAHGAGATHVDVLLMDSPTGARMWEGRFSSIADC